MSIEKDITTWVFCTFEFCALHRWEQAEGRQAYLRHVHRHKFHVKAYKKVSHLDRDIEFIALKEKMEDFVRDRWERQSITLSCEMIGRDLIDEFDLDSVEVSEDGENGCVMHVDKGMP